MDLSLASHRAILKALQAFEDGELALVVGGLLTVATTEGDVRFLDGTCFSAPRREWIGAELVGWLEELEQISGVGAWWRPGLRAVLRTREGRACVTAGSCDLSVGACPATGGFATHTARFLVAHGDAAKDTGAHPLAAITSGVRPAVAHPAAQHPAPHRPPVPRPPDSGVTLRERGEWRTMAMDPWTLGDGRPPPQLTQPVFGPLPRVLPPPRAVRAPVSPRARAGR